MRVLILTQYFWPENFRINDLATGLCDLGHAVTVLTGKPNYPGGRLFPGYSTFGQTQEQFGAVRVLRVPLAGRGNGSGLRLFFNYLSFAFWASVLGPGRCAGEFDVIFVYEPSPITVGIPARVMKWVKCAPIMFWVQDLWPESLTATGAIRAQPMLKFVEWLVRWIYQGCDRVLVQSEAFIEPVGQMGVAAERILYFPNSAEAFYQPMAPEDAPEFDALPSGFRIMFAGNIGAAQSFESILDAATRLREVRDIHWLILGEGRQRTWVEKEIQTRDLSACVHLLGRYPADAMPRWFAHADAMLVTLRDDPVFARTVPAKVQSYMACAKPIVAALDGEGARVVRESGAGLAVAADDAEALARAVLEMYKMPEPARRAMGARGRQYFEARFERRMLLSQLEGWMENVVAKTKACAS